jgi:hypothetical protein
MVRGPRYECPFEAVRNGVKDLIKKPCFVRKRVILMTQTLMQRGRKQTVKTTYYKYVPIDLANLSSVIASGAKQSPRPS